jgi:hypothetical protein
MATAAGDRIVYAEILIIEQHPSQSCLGIGDGIGTGIVLVDVAGPWLVCIVCKIRGIDATLIAAYGSTTMGVVVAGVSLFEQLTAITIKLKAVPIKSWVLVIKVLLVVGVVGGGYAALTMHILIGLMCQRIYFIDKRSKREFFGQKGGFWLDAESNENLRMAIDYFGRKSRTA